jgi:multidrug efflux pump subunit AcrA (membrane-fusion protein)
VTVANGRNGRNLDPGIRLVLEEIRDLRREMREERKEYRRQTEADRRQAEADHRQAEADRQQAEADRRRAEADRQQAEADRKRADAERRRSDERFEHLIREFRQDSARREAATQKMFRDIRTVGLSIVKTLNLHTRILERIDRKLGAWGNSGPGPANGRRAS